VTPALPPKMKIDFCSNFLNVFKQRLERWNWKVYFWLAKHFTKKIVKLKTKYIKFRLKIAWVSFNFQVKASEMHHSWSETKLWICFCTNRLDPAILKLHLRAPLPLDFLQWWYCNYSIERKLRDQHGWIDGGMICCSLRPKGDLDLCFGDPGATPLGWFA